MTPLLVSSPSLLPDIQLPILGLKGDVKSVAVGKKYATISETKHRSKMSRPDFYFLVDFQSEAVCRVGLVRSEEVDTWERRQKRGWYFSRSTEELYFPSNAEEVQEWLERLRVAKGSAVHRRSQNPLMR